MGHGQALDVVARVRAACREADGVDPMDEATWLAFRRHGFDGARVAWEDDGFALERDGDLTLAVLPEARRQRLGRRLLGQVIDSADRAWSHGDHPGARALAVAVGWSRARELWVMRRPTSAPLPELEVPDGLEVRGFRDGDLDAVLAVNAAAFADHPEQGSLDRAGFTERAAESWFDPPGLLVAIDRDGALVAFHWTKVHDPAHGEVYVVGVSPDAQGRGLGRVITLAGLHHLQAQGVDEVHLYVEQDNRAARTVYERLGFTHAAADTHVQYRPGTGAARGLRNPA